jgi:hypothetical protein
MKQSTKRLYVSLGSLVLIAGSLYVYATLIKPEFLEIQTLRGERQAQSRLLADYKTTIEETNRVLAKYESVSVLQDNFSEVIPPSENIPSFLNQVYGLASLNNVFIDSIEFQYLPIQSVPAGSLIKPFGTLRALVTSSSNYEDMKGFISSLETNIRLMDIDSINISEGAIGSDPMLSYTLVVDAYYQTQ